MAVSTLSHPYRVDRNTLASASASSGTSAMQQMPQFPSDLRLLTFSPIVFTHAYELLGEAPQRFADDLSLYLSTIITYFSRAGLSGDVDLTGVGNTDSKRRLSEDLGVAYSSVFMVNVFGLTWESISQIPSNRQLSKKRPDFQGYTTMGSRHLFEAKGTTALAGIQGAMTKATQQIKTYPEKALTKLAIVTYLCSDNRFFPSASFVVDPVALPDNVPPDYDTSRLLHYEKVLQFIGLPEVAKAYVSLLGTKLTLESKNAVLNEWNYRQKLQDGIRGLASKFRAERTQVGLQTERYRDIDYLGRTTRFETLGVSLFNGASEAALRGLLALELPETKFETSFEENDGGFFSRFSDGTLLRLSFTNNKD